MKNFKLKFNEYMQNISRSKRFSKFVLKSLILLLRYAKVILVKLGGVERE